MDTRITATHLAKSLSDVLNRVRYRGQQFVVVRNGEPVATLAPAGLSSGVTMAEVMASIGHIKMPRDGFANDLEQVQHSQPMAKLAEWPSS